MDAFVSRKRRREAFSQSTLDAQDEESTDLKLTLLASLHPELAPDVLLDALLLAEGSVERASEAISGQRTAAPPKKLVKTIGYQCSIMGLIKSGTVDGDGNAIKPLTKRGKTFYLYSPEDIEKHTPCSIIHNFLPSAQADALLRELLGEASSFKRETFQLFDKTVESPHSMAFYVDSLQQERAQRTEYVYNGSYISDIRRTLPEMLAVSTKVRDAVNSEIQRRIKTFYHEGKKLKYQSPHEWVPNASFVNCYDGGAESVGYHSDQLTYLGPRAVIGSLSLGVAREFRVRQVVPQDGDETSANATADAQGQISIHLPHNSLLVMHAEMQETWKHAVAPAPAIDPHPVAGSKRINVTYRCYKESLHPRFTPKCRCGIPTVLRCVQKKKENRGRYMWMCHAGYTPGRKGCTFFRWAEFDDDGEPPWAIKVDGRKGSGHEDLTRSEDD
ncbi:hypothetical protein H2203_005445 [Taxawa tesnikishii (nom. ined.)]|nr:hypothetical protein H2203_005445 [Dothideales sp. JES 119]